MKIKVCGMKYPENINQLKQLSVDFIGFIFYQKSPRYIGDLEPDFLTSLPQTLSRVGVFLNEDMEMIACMVKRYRLTHVQLHGQESPDFCVECRKIQGVKIIKAFNISDVGDLMATSGYVGKCDYFLFDTKSPQHGGSGLKFDWNILNEYKEGIPFFLSGGISDSDIDIIKKLSFSKLYALDLNSKFEIEPGLKDIEKLKKFITHFKTK